MTEPPSLYPIQVGDLVYPYSVEGLCAAREGDPLTSRLCRLAPDHAGQPHASTVPGPLPGSAEVTAVWW